MKIELEHRHSDYGPDSGGYIVLRYNGEWIGQVEDVTLARKMIEDITQLETDKNALKTQLDAAKLGGAL